MKPEETIDFHIRWAWHGIARLYNAEAAKYDSTMATGYVLLSIDLDEGTPSTKLGPKMGMESRSLTRTLKNLEEKQLIVRKPDKVDGRMVRVFLTEEGKRQREVAKHAVIHLNEKIQSQLPKGKLNTFFEVMSRINEILESQDIFNYEEKH